MQGEHLKETCYINSSLSTLGRVIQQLVDQQKTGRKGHIPYRESRLTFLLQVRRRAAAAHHLNAAQPMLAVLHAPSPCCTCASCRYCLASAATAGMITWQASVRGAPVVYYCTQSLHRRRIPHDAHPPTLPSLRQDSLGGNAKTMIIANVSPSAMCGHETISTLQFATRAKCMRNRAHINVDAQGDKQLLQREIQRLNTELDQLRKGQADPAIAENKELRQRLDTWVTGWWQQLGSSVVLATAR